MGQLQNCCCCVPLRTGALVIAILFLASNIFLFLSSLFSLPALISIRRIDTSDSSAASNNNTAQAEVVFNTNLSILWIYTIASIVVSFINIIFNSLLVHGINQQARRYVKAWVVWYAILNTLATLAWLALNIYMLTALSWVSPEARRFLLPFVVASVLGGGGGLALLWYLYVCVVSYFRSEEAQGRSYGVQNMVGAAGGRREPPKYTPA